jgi:hypothetical protein
MMGDLAKKCYAKFAASSALAQKIEEHFSEDIAWSCVIRFYAALHLMNAYLIDKHNVRLDPTVSAHPDRKKAMDRCPELREAPHRYRELKELSEWVRYDANFEYTPEHPKKSKAFLEKIIAIVEPKLQRV